MGRKLITGAVRAIFACIDRHFSHWLGGFRNQAFPLKAPPNYLQILGKVLKLLCKSLAAMLTASDHQEL